MAGPWRAGRGVARPCPSPVARAVEGGGTAGDPVVSRVHCAPACRVGRRSPLAVASGVAVAGARCVRQTAAVAAAGRGISKNRVRQPRCGGPAVRIVLVVSRRLVFTLLSLLIRTRSYITRIACVVCDVWCRCGVAHPPGSGSRHPTGAPRPRGRSSDSIPSAKDGATRGEWTTPPGSYLAAGV